MTGSRTAGEGLRTLLTLVVARRCGGCGEPLWSPPPGRGGLDGAQGCDAWCGHCRDRWGPSPGWWHPTPGGCPGWAAATYRGRVRRSVLAAKRGGHASAQQLLLARWPAGRLPAGCDVTWVPGHPRRARRGTDAGRALAEAVARREGVAARPLLGRAAGGRRQAGLTDDERRADPARLGLRLQRRPQPVVVLVDDVRTTGTTLDHAARLLRAGGALRVMALVVANAPGRPDS